MMVSKKEKELVLAAMIYGYTAANAKMSFGEAKKRIKKILEIKE